ncbi:MAG: hypothetical protein JW950_09910 [Deltaproteobacteria bacterium]|nr:hypothetical protein [Deltaproteobacteria bacterium]
MQGKESAARKILCATLALIASLAIAVPEAPCADGEAVGAKTSPRHGAESENGISYRIHVTIDGETLGGIAGQSRIYGDNLKWPLIYLLNREELGKLRLAPEALSITPLPAGLVLAIMLPEEARKRSARAAEEKPWVINILSSLNANEITPMVVRLIDGGYFAYISEWHYKDKRWKRLRVGFFADRETANEQGRKITEKLGLSTFWTVKADWDELNEYAGYFD